MGRHLETGMPWFHHSIHASRKSNTVRMLTARYGLAGRGFWWTMLEEIYGRAPEYFYLDDDRIKDLANSMFLSRKKFLEMVEFSVLCGGFSESGWQNGRELTSPNIEAEIKAVFKERGRHREGNGEIGAGEIPEK